MTDDQLRTVVNASEDARKNPRGTYLGRKINSRYVDIEQQEGLLDQLQGIPKSYIPIFICELLTAGLSIYFAWYIQQPMYT